MRDLESSSHLCDFFFLNFFGAIIFQLFDEIGGKRRHYRLKTKTGKILEYLLPKGSTTLSDLEKKIKFGAEFFVEYV